MNIWTENQQIEGLKKRFGLLFNLGSDNKGLLWLLKPNASNLVATNNRN
jgi:hypothetical protein